MIIHIACAIIVFPM